VTRFWSILVVPNTAAIWWVLLISDLLVVAREKLDGLLLRMFEAKDNKTIINRSSGWPAYQVLIK
jgi:hypothetical protein